MPRLSRIVVPGYPHHDTQHDVCPVGWCFIRLGITEDDSLATERTLLGLVED